MKKKIVLSIILVCFLFTLTGCYDASTIEDAYYIVALGIDLTEDNLYNISIQIAQTSNGSSGSSSGSSSQSSEYTIYNVEAQTIDSGISILNNYLNKKINLSHCSAIVFSEKLARRGIGGIINSLANNHEIRPNSYVLISSKTAYDVLEKVSNSGENFSARFYEYIINSVDYTGYSAATTFDDLFSKINNSSGDAISTYTVVEDDAIQNNGLAIFKNDYMVGSVTAMDSVAHLILTNKLEESLITLEDPFDSPEKVDLEIALQKDCDKDVQIINNTPFITCNISIGANIKSSGEHFDYISDENIKVIEQKATQYLHDLISNYLYTLAKEYDADIFNFQNIYSKKCLTNQDLEKVHFRDIYKESFFDVNVKVKIGSTHLFEKE